jgi:hypothetical protein
MQWGRWAEQSKQLFEFQNVGQAQCGENSKIKEIGRLFFHIVSKKDSSFHRV